MAGGRNEDVRKKTGNAQKSVLVFVLRWLGNKEGGSNKIPYSIVPKISPPPVYKPMGLKST